MQVETTRLGAVEVADDRLLEMVGPILGFPGLSRYALIPAGLDSPFHWVQSTDDADLAFAAVSPFLFFPAYDFELPGGDQEELALQTAEDAEVLVFVTIPEDARQMTANLLAPIIVNRATRRAKQVVLYDTEYTTRHYLLPREAREADGVPAEGAEAP